MLQQEQEGEGKKALKEQSPNGFCIAKPIMLFSSQRLVEEIGTQQPQPPDGVYPHLPNKRPNDHKMDIFHRAQIALSGLKLIFCFQN